MILKSQPCQARLFAIAAALAFSTLAAESTASPDTKQEWKQVPEILRRIVPPKFPARDFVITNFGAVGRRPNGLHGGDCQGHCRLRGRRAAGTSMVPAGEFLTGPIHLQSNVDLHLAGSNAVLKFSTDPKNTCRSSSRGLKARNVTIIHR
jgi:hypothetical protein